jgi:DNA-binding transcriptional LysR family regulator
MFKTESLIAFVLVAKYKSFTLAAKEQQQSTMAISKQISQLESRLQEPLFIRTTRIIKLTEFGENFLLRAKEILAQHDALDIWLDSRKGYLEGTIKVVAQDVQTYEETIFPWVGEFQRLYPDIKLVFEVNESPLDLNQHHHDIYWGIGEYLGIQSPSLKRRSLWQAQLGIFASPDYLKSHGMPKSIEELRGHKMIGHPHSNPNNILVIKSKSDPTGMDVVELDAPILTVSNQSNFAAQGLGLINALVDNHDIKDYLAKKQLIPVLEEHWLSSAEIYIYYQHAKIEQVKIRAFIDFFLSKRQFW